MTRLWAIITGHSHFWGVPIKSDDVWYLPCFECGKMKRLTCDLEVK